MDVVSQGLNSGCPGPSGLYGAVSDCLVGEYDLLNGSGFVLTHPPESPAQCYAWLVLEDLSAVSFIDSVRMRSHMTVDNEVTEKRFVGSMSPPVCLCLDGKKALLK